MGRRMHASCIASRISHLHMYPSVYGCIHISTIPASIILREQNTTMAKSKKQKDKRRARSKSATSVAPPPARPTEHRRPTHTDDGLLHGHGSRKLFSL